MKRLCVIDMNFVWPPDGGAPVNVYNMAGQFARKYETTLLIPRLVRLGRFVKQPWPLSATKFFLRGQVPSRWETPFKVKTIDLELRAFHPDKVGKIVREKVEELESDYVFVADAWYFKPKLVLALGDYRPVVRLYVHEMMCLKGNGILFRHGRVCPINYLDGTSRSWITCVTCASRFYLSYPSPRWIFEFMRSRAFLRKFQRDCMEALNSASCILVGNQFMASRLQPFVETTVRVAPAGIPLEKFKFQEDLQRRDGKTRFLVLGRMDMKVKGLSVVVQACRELWKKRRNFRLMIASRGKLPSDAFIERVPWIPYEEIHKIYERTDAVIIPSLWPDILPQVGFEAMAFGLPIIGSNVGGIPEQVEDGVTGFLFAPGDIKTLAEKMSWVIDHEGEAREMGKKGRERVSRLFSIEHVFSRFYSDLFEASPTAQPGTSPRMP